MSGNGEVRYLFMVINNYKQFIEELSFN